MTGLDRLFVILGAASGFVGVGAGGSCLLDGYRFRLRHAVHGSLGDGLGFGRPGDELDLDAALRLGDGFGRSCRE